MLKNYLEATKYELAHIRLRTQKKTITNSKPKCKTTTISTKTLAYLDPSSQVQYVTFQLHVHPYMYFLPNIHRTPANRHTFCWKTNHKWIYSSPTAKISEYVDHFLLPYSNHPNYRDRIRYTQLSNSRGLKNLNRLT